jgi:hypothetical protein
VRQVVESAVAPFILWWGLADWPAALAGVVLVLLGLWDMALAVLHVQGDGPLSSRLTRLVWRSLVLFSSPLSTKGRDAVLAWGVPLMTGAMICLWVVLFVGGFGLIYTPVIQNTAWFAATQAHRAASPVFDALYASAVSFLTVGYGDVVPVHPWTRFLAVLEGAFGLLTVSLSVTYLVSVFPIILRKTALAADLNQQLRGEPHGLVIAQRYVKAGREEALCGRLEKLGLDLVSLGLSHGFYPLLYYTRSRRAHESFVRILVGVQALAALRYVLDPRAHRALVADPRFEALEEALLYTLHTIEESIHFRIEEGRAAPPNEPATRARARTDEPAGPKLADLCAEAERLGLVAVDCADTRVRRLYARFQEATDPYILAYARSAAIDGDVWRPYDRHERDTEFEAGDDEPVPAAAA